MVALLGAAPPLNTNGLIVLVKVGAAKLLNSGAVILVKTGAAMVPKNGAWRLLKTGAVRLLNGVTVLVVPKPPTVVLRSGSRRL